MPAPKGFITITNAHAGYGNPRIAVDSIVWYVRAKDGASTVITLKSADEDGSEVFRALETENEIDAMIAAAQGDSQ